MKKKGFTPGQIIGSLKEAQVFLGQMERADKK